MLEDRAVSFVRGAIDALSIQERVELCRTLPGWDVQIPWLSTDLDRSLREIRRIRWSDGLRCVFCSADEIVRWGKQRGKQRYRCRACGRCFNDLTGTPLAHIRKPWGRFARSVEYRLEGKTIRESARQAGVSVPTAWRWWHVALRSLRALADDTAPEEACEIEPPTGDSL